MTRDARSSAIWLRGTAQLRRHMRSWLGLALLIGLAGGFVVAAAAGARRTTTAYDRLLATSHPFDVYLGIGCPEATDEDGCPGFAAASVDTIRALAPVADAAAVRNFLVPILTEDGFSVQPQDEVFAGPGDPPGEVCYTGNGEVDVLGSPSGRFGSEMNTNRFVAGRAANPARADEAVMSVAAARRAHVQVGDSLRIVPVDACGDVSPDEWPDPLTVTVVGLHVTPGEVQPETGRYLQSVTVTAPLLDTLTTAMGDTTSVAVVLRPGATTAELMAALEDAGIPGQVVISQSEFTAAVRRGLRPDALTLWLLAALSGAATVIVLGQALARQAWAGAEDLPALRAMGFTGRDIAAAGAVEGAVVALIAGLSAVAFAVASSPLFPIGRARVAEPEPGLRVDLMAIGIGALLVAMGSFVVVVATVRFVAARTARPRVTTARASSITMLLGRLGARPPVVVGARMALERGHGQLGVPVLTGFAGIAVGVAALVGSLAFAANLDHLLDTPRLVGWNWDVASFDLPEPEQPDDDRTTQIEAIVRAARAVPGVERAGYATFFPPTRVPLIDEVPELWPLSFSSGPASIAPTVTSGRAPSRSDELLVTKSVLADLGLRVGDALELHGGTETDSGFEPITESVTIVGTGVLPIGDGQFEQTLALTYEGMRRLAPDVEPQLIIIDLARSADRSRTLAALAELGLGQRLGDDALNITALVDLDVGRAGDLPRLIGALMAVLAIGVLIHLVYAGARASRLDLATLRAIGFTRAQVATTMAWQSTTAMLLPFAAGAIGGAIAGSSIWLAYAERLGVAQETVVAWRPIAGVLIAFLVLANLVGVVIAQGQRRLRPADVLRAD